ncbi:MAG: DNA-directed RNA polymerase subunit beta'', partial [Vampirovibrionales bacterium]
MMSSPYTQDAFIASASVTTKPSFEYINENLNKKGLEKLLLKVYETMGTAKTAQLANALKDLGFRFATLAGVTISIEDLEVPEAKKGLLERAEKEIETASKRYQHGEITEVERYTKVIDTWSETTVKLTEEVVKSFDRLNPIYMMAFSGARGNLSQVRQLVGMRGLMADSQGQIIDIPIKTNFREGLSVTEYIISSYGARKGLVDTALKTADSGYLTRRLVDVAQDVIITQDDCGTERGVYLAGITEGDTQVVKLADRIVSRTLQEDIKNAEGQVVYPRGEVISISMAQEIAKLGYTRVFVRSGLTCESPFGICQKCYGWSLTTNRIVDMGEAIGIMAAQSIGEPGTQLTMRTFHTGGVFSGGTVRQRITADVAGTIVGEMPPLREVRTRHGDVVMMTTRDAFIKIQPTNGKKEIEVTIPFNTVLHFSDMGVQVEKDQLLGEYELGSRDSGRLTERATKDISTDVPGLLSYEGFEVDEKRDRQGNISRTATRSGTIWALSGDVYTLPPASQLAVEDGQWVMEGNTLAETLITTEFGGEVRLPENLETKSINVEGEMQEVITQGKELTVVIASIEPSNATLHQTKKELLWKVASSEDTPEETYVIKTPNGSVIENGMPIAELLDNTAEVPCSGEIRYHDVDISEHDELLSQSMVYFIPEEIHTISKSSSLKSPGLKHGEFVKAHTELVPGVMTHTEGLLEIVEDGDIIHEMVIRPGELHRVTEVSALKVEDGQIIEAGTEVAPGLVAKERHMVSLFYPQVASNHAGDDEDLGDDMEDGLFGEDDFFGEEIDATPVEAAYVDVLLRPVYEYDIAPHQAQITFTGPDDQDITLKAVTKLQYADREKVRHIEGGSLLKTQLVLSMEGQLSRLKGAVEVYQSGDDAQTLRLVVLENLTIRRDLGGEQGHKMNAALQTLLMVKHGDVIEKKTPVVKTRVLAKKGGQI